LSFAKRDGNCHLLAIAQQPDVNDRMWFSTSHAPQKFFGCSDWHFIEIGDDVAFLDPKQIGWSIWLNVINAHAEGFRLRVIDALHAITLESEHPLAFRTTTIFAL